MEPRERDLLNAEARFLNDYCGEAAVHRWRASLSDAERERLAPAPDLVLEACRRVVGALQRNVLSILEVLTTILRGLYEALSAAFATVTGRTAGRFGHGTA